MHNFFRIACVVPDVFVGDVQKNTLEIISYIQKAENESSDLVVFPELSVTGCTCGDLFFRSALINESDKALEKIACATSDKNVICIVGAPLNVDGQLYDCAVIISQGKIRGAVPKTYIPQDGEAGQKRWFSSAYDVVYPKDGVKLVSISGQSVPFGADVIFDICDGVKFGAEIGCDLFSPIPPSSKLAMSGAVIVANLCASNEIVSRRESRCDAVKSQSKAALCAYACVSAGKNESTTDLIYSGHSVVFENGKLLAQNKEYIDSNYIMYADVDMDILFHERASTKIFKDCAKNALAYSLYEAKACDSHEFLSNAEYRSIKKLPFVPDVKEKRLSRCSQIFDMQVSALVKRLTITNSKPVVGVSGGLDSTLTLLVCAMAAQKMGLEPCDVLGVTMPCFGTTDRTYENSLKLMDALGVTIKVVPIKDAVRQHFCDIEHDEAQHNLTYENSQARERTQVLMDLAGDFGGLVVGTGDLSELALGWCTYNADHMSMYGTNAGIPKTLIRWLIDSVCTSDLFPKATKVLLDIMDTPISPELLPPDEDGKIAQKTEDVVGPYALHDFYLYYFVRYGMSKEKILFLAKKAFCNDFDDETIQKWLNTFMWRFRTQQFKRSCLPDGVKIGSVGLSPRGDWVMPSDACALI